MKCLKQNVVLSANTVKTREPVDMHCHCLSHAVHCQNQSVEYSKYCSLSGLRVETLETVETQQSRDSVDSVESDDGEMCKRRKTVPLVPLSSYQFEWESKVLTLLLQLV